MVRCRSEKSGQPPLVVKSGSIKSGSIPSTQEALTSATSSTIADAIWLFAVNK